MKLKNIMQSWATATTAHPNVSFPLSRHSLTHKHTQKLVWASMWAIQILSAFVRHAVSQSFTCAVLWVVRLKLESEMLNTFILTHHIWTTPDSQNFGAPLQIIVSLSLSLALSQQLVFTLGFQWVCSFPSHSPQKRRPACLHHPSGVRGEGPGGWGWGNSLGLKWDADPFSVGLSVLLFSPQPPTHLFRSLIQRSLLASTSGSLFVSFPYLKKSIAQALFPSGSMHTFGETDLLSSCNGFSVVLG